MNSRTISEKDTLGQMDLVEKFVHSDVRKINITDKIWFSRYVFLDQLNNQEFLFFILVQTVSQFFALHIGISTAYSNLIQFGFVVFVFYQGFFTGSLRMSEKCGTLKGFGFRKGRPTDDRKI